MKLYKVFLPNSEYPARYAGSQEAARHERKELANLAKLNDNLEDKKEVLIETIDVTPMKLGILETLNKESRAASRGHVRNAP